MLGQDVRIVAVIHLPALPGAPRHVLPMAAIRRGAADEARLLADAGVHALILENFGDVPFRAGPAEPHTIAAMTACALAVREATSLPLGLNVLRCDPVAALGIAAITGASFVRVNVHVGVRVTDQGVIQGQADRSVRLRRELGVSVSILADVDVKHSGPLSPRPIEDEAVEAIERGLADGVIVTGARTGVAVDLDSLRRVRAVTTAPLVAGSGVTAGTVASVLAIADAVIVGSALRTGGRAGAALERANIEAFVEAASIRS